MKLKCAVIPINILIPKKFYASVFICCSVKGSRIRSRSCNYSWKVLYSVRMAVLGKFLDPWTLAPLSSWRLILFDSSHKLISSFLNDLKNKKEWWCTKVCHRRMYVVKKIVICQLNPLSNAWNLGASWR